MFSKIIKWLKGPEFTAWKCDACGKTEVCPGRKSPEWVKYTSGHYVHMIYTPKKVAIKGVVCDFGDYVWCGCVESTRQVHFEGI